MRNALHRAVLRRFAFRASVLAAFVVALGALAAPLGWFDSDALRVGMLGFAGVLAALPLVPTLARKPRARVTAPRTVVSEA